MILFLHGAGERGANLNLVKVHGPPKIVQQQPDFPFIVVSPQCPSGLWWTNSVQLDALNELLDAVIAECAVDVERVYLTGLSMGGYGAWHYALSKPSRFAAIVPIAGGYEHGSDEVPDNICDLEDLPIWVFHGAEDDVVLPRQSEVLVNALRACPSEVRFTLYSGATHDESWKLAYADPELYEWLLAQTLEE